MSTLSAVTWLVILFIACLDTQLTCSMLLVTCVSLYYWVQALQPPQIPQKKASYTPLTPTSPKSILGI